MSVPAGTGTGTGAAEGSGTARRHARVGLCLGGGAVQGAIWLEGALSALADELGWAPGQADVLVGTSAGSWLATLLAAGVPPWLLAAQTGGEIIPGLVPGTRPPVPTAVTARQRLAGLRPGASLELVMRAAMRPVPSSAARWWTGALPRGAQDSGVRELVREVVPSGWPDHPNLWIVALDLRSGRRAVFGRDADRPADVADAVAASCAVPAVFQPVRIGGRDYVDGGMHSFSNLDLLAGHRLDVVICLNPASTLDVIDVRGMVDLPWRVIRGNTGPRLGREARKVRERGTAVQLLQPERLDIEVLGRRWLRPHRVPEVLAQARETVKRQLDRSPLRGLLEELPQGPEHLVRRPGGDPSGWPSITRPPSWLPEVP